MTQRFFVLPSSIQAGSVTFDTARAHQIRDVLRMRQNQEIIVLDNAGSEYRVILKQVDRHGVRGKILEQRAPRGEPGTRVILYQSLLKTDKFEWVLQKGTEVGIAEFVPIVAARSVANDVSKQKFARWSQIIVEAAEQSGRGKIPTLYSHQSFTESLTGARQLGGMLLIPWEQEQTRSLSAALAINPSETIHLFIGPEGGWTGAEIEQADAAGALSITLGSRILRAETAGLVAASAIFYARGDLNPA